MGARTAGAGHEARPAAGGKALEEPTWRDDVAFEIDGDTDANLVGDGLVLLSYQAIEASTPGAAGPGQRRRGRRRR